MSRSKTRDPSQHLLKGSGKLDEKPDRDGDHQPETCGTILFTGSLELYSPNDNNYINYHC